MPITGLPYVLDSQLRDDATALEDRLQANFDFLQNNITGPGSFLALAVQAGSKIAFGAASLSLTSPAVQTTATVTHGLGTTPTVVLLAPESIGASYYAPMYDTVGATTFRIVQSVPVTFTGLFHVSWAVIG